MLGRNQQFLCEATQQSIAIDAADRAESDCLEAGLDAVQQRTQSSRGTLILARDGGELRVTSGRSHGSCPVAGGAPLSTCTVLMEGHGLLVDGRRRRPTPEACRLERCTGAQCCIPLTDRGDAVGALLYDGAPVGYATFGDGEKVLEAKQDSRVQRQTLGRPEAR